jgi:uncharacterized protein (TIGR00730 family)
MMQLPLSADDILHRENLKKIAKNSHFRVAIFWSARIKPEDELYQSISDFTKNLAIKWYDIVTGGGPWAMEAASKWHHNACEDCRDHASTVGINIQLPFEQKPNRYLDIAQTVPTFSARLDTFMVLSDVFVITPGGIGTLLELFYTWQLMQVGHICRAPIILWWEEYKWLKKFIQEAVLAGGYINKEEAELTIQVNTMDEVLALIDKAHEADEKLGDKACINIKQYIAGAKALGLID